MLLINLQYFFRLLFIKNGFQFIKIVLDILIVVERKSE